MHATGYVSAGTENKIILNAGTRLFLQIQDQSPGWKSSIRFLALVYVLDYFFRKNPIPEFYLCNCLF
jgi:hypothetical protein